MAADPRDRITQTAFGVSPELVGVALASPARRASALGLDLLLAAIVSEGGGPVVAGLVSATLFVLVAMRTPSRSRLRRAGRAALVGIGALILFGVATDLVDDATSDEDPDEWATPTLPPDPGGPAGPALAEAERRLAAAGLDVDLTAGVEVAPLDTAAAALALRAYADALADRDARAADSLRGAASTAAAGTELAGQRERIGRLRGELGELEDRNRQLTETVESPSFLRALWALAADVGLVIGWVGVYFTLTLAFWSGYSPGKRLLGIRVVRLDGQRLSLWTAFERFGGYAAGLATGLVGFAQVLWDPNRQGVQDKVAGTVVVRMDRPDAMRRAV